jgi:hypothetical protein
MRSAAPPRACRALSCLTIALTAWLAPARTALAADATEFWPEANVFVNLKPRSRLFFDVPYANGKASEHAVLELAAYLDISIKPIRKTFQTQDWQRSRYLWTRIGYDRVFHDLLGADATVAENRGIVSVYAKALLPAGVVGEGRVRADLRWIGGDYSTRYRLRGEVTREFSVLGHPVVPFFNVECFYDTRYDGWARILYQLGPEVTLSPHFRFEIYLARQDDRLPGPSDLDALGLNLKWYY